MAIHPDTPFGGFALCFVLLLYLYNTHILIASSILVCGGDVVRVKGLWSGGWVVVDWWHLTRLDITYRVAGCG
jgi:hypothetical protein